LTELPAVSVTTGWAVMSTLTVLVVGTEVELPLLARQVIVRVGFPPEFVGSAAAACAD